MATSNLGSLVDVRSVITVARREGERLAGRLSRDVQALVFKSPAELAADVRQIQHGVRTRADAAVKDLEARGAIVFGAVERQLANASTAVLRRFSGAVTRSEVDALTSRIAHLEKRLASLERSRRKSRRPTV
jgi:hypothetical protein